MSTLPGAILAAMPYPYQIPIPTAAPTDAPLVCVSFARAWVPYVVGALTALRADSTWNSDDENTVATVKDNVDALIALFMALEACPMPIMFQNNPSQPINFQYSLDGGTTWNNGPDQAVHITPAFTVDVGAPGGYDLSVNGGDTSDAIPMFTAIDPEAIVKDPATTLGNLITATAGADGLLIQALSTIGVKLVQANGVAAAFQKVFPGLDLATSVLEVVAGTDYSYPLLEIVSSI